jgi:hypothetical protein
MPANQAESRSNQDIKGVSGGWSSRGANLTAAGRYGRLRSLGKRLLVYISGSVGPGDAVCFGWVALLVDLSLECSLHFSNLFVAEAFLDPADHDFFGQIGVRDQVVGALETNAAIGRTGIRSIVGGNGVMTDENETICGLPLEGVNGPDKGGSHEKKAWYL